MSETDVTWWASFWGKVEYWAFLGVVITLAVEFIAHRAGAPYREQLEHDKDLRIAELGQQTQEANARAAEANLALERFRAPRSLTKGGAEVLIRDLRKFSGTEIDIFSMGSTLEIANLTTAISAALAGSGWRARAWQMFSGSAVGVLVTIKEGSTSQTQQAAQSLVTALNAAGIPSQEIPVPSAWKDWSVPGVMSGPAWENDKAAAIRMIVGAKE